VSAAHTAAHTATHTATLTATHCNTNCNTHCNALQHTLQTRFFGIWSKKIKKRKFEEGEWWGVVKGLIVGVGVEQEAEVLPTTMVNR